MGTYRILPLKQCVTGEGETYRGSVASFGFHVGQLAPIPVAVQYDPPEANMVFRKVCKRCSSISIFDEPGAPFEGEDAALRAEIRILWICSLSRNISTNHNAWQEVGLTSLWGPRPSILTCSVKVQIHSCSEPRLEASGRR